jgi:hypothetical protein
LAAAWEALVVAEKQEGMAVLEAAEVAVARHTHGWHSHYQMRHPAHCLPKTIHRTDSSSLAMLIRRVVEEVVA